MTAKNARQAVEADADGIIVSNHGGRVLPYSPATAEVLPEIVEAVGVSRSTLVRIFARELGRSPGEEIIRERVELAKKLMATGSLSMAEVAFKAGFCNPPYFSNIFKRLVGEMTAEERKAVKDML